MGTAQINKSVSIACAATAQTSCMWPIRWLQQECGSFLNLGPKLHKISNNLMTLCTCILEEYSEPRFMIQKNISLKKIGTIASISQYRWILLPSPPKDLSQKCIYKSVCQNSKIFLLLKIKLWEILTTLCMDYKRQAMS